MYCCFTPLTCLHVLLFYTVLDWRNWAGFLKKKSWAGLFLKKKEEKVFFFEQ